MQVEHGIISLSNMGIIRSLVNSDDMALFALTFADDLDFSKGKAVHSWLPRSW